MSVKIFGKNLELGESLREYSESKIRKLAETYLDEDVDSNITINKDKNIFETEICLHLNKGFVIKANGASDDAYQAVDIALQRLEWRVQRHKNRIKDKARRSEWGKAVDAVRYVLERKPSSSDGDEEHLIIAEQESSILPLSVSEAVMKLDLTEMPVVMFKNADNGRINVVYKRGDGHIGWIDYKS